MPKFREWVTYAQTGATPMSASATPTAIDLFSDVESERGDRITPCTVTRIIGHIDWYASAESTNVDGTAYSCAAGILVVRRQIATASQGDSEIPNPLDDLQEKWLWKWSQRLTVDKQQTNGAQYPLYPSPVWPLDVRVSRKIGSNETLALVLATDATTTHEPNVFKYTRSLILT